MVRYFQEGGFGMWLILFIALAGATTALFAKGERRCRALWIGSYGSLVAGVLGMAAGMVAVSKNVGRYADKGAAVAEGLGELSNNGSFAAILATVLAVAAVVLTPKAEQRTA